MATEPSDAGMPEKDVAEALEYAAMLRREKAVWHHPAKQALLTLAAEIERQRPIWESTRIANRELCANRDRLRREHEALRADYEAAVRDLLVLEANVKHYRERADSLTREHDQAVQERDEL